MLTIVFVWFVECTCFTAGTVNGSNVCEPNEEGLVRVRRMLRDCVVCHVKIPTTTCKKITFMAAQVISYLKIIK